MHEITAKQLYRAKILRLAALAQDDSLFYRVIIPGLFVHFFLNETAPCIQSIRFATITRRPLVREYSQVESVMSLSP